MRAGRAWRAGRGGRMADDRELDFRAAAAAGMTALQRWYRPVDRPVAYHRLVERRERADRGDRLHRSGPATRPTRASIEPTFSRAPAQARGLRQHLLRRQRLVGAGLGRRLRPDRRGPLPGRGPHHLRQHCATGWDDTCGGGVWWNTTGSTRTRSPTSCSSTLAARLHQRVPGGGEYLAWAQREWDWFSARGMIGAGGLVNDGLTAACENNGGVTWTYNQGVVLGGLAALHEITGEPRVPGAGRDHRRRRARPAGQPAARPRPAS